MAQACDVPGAWDALEGTFEEVRERFMQDTTWIRFYVRPCCPPPGRRVAEGRTDELIEQIAMLDRFTDEQRAELLGMARSRFEWYCKKFQRA